jgi:hypothetical protein
MFLITTVHKFMLKFTVYKYMFLFTVQKYMPDDLPMIDDNSDLTLLGYKNILIEPQVQYTSGRIRSFLDGLGSGRLGAGSLTFFAVRKVYIFWC